jgi:hypothetical protein
MFYRSVPLDEQSKAGIKALESAYNMVRDVLNKLPEGSRTKVFAETHLQQSYMWSVACIEEAAVKASVAPQAPVPAVPAPAVPAPVVAAPAVPVVAPPAPVVAPPVPVPIIPTFALPDMSTLAPPPPVAPISNTDVLTNSTKDLDSLMVGIKELTEQVRSGLSLK